MMHAHPIVHTLNNSLRFCILRATVSVALFLIMLWLKAGLQGTIRGTCQSMLTTDGFMGFFVGFGATVFRDVPFSFVQVVS